MVKVFNLIRSTIYSYPKTSSLLHLIENSYQKLFRNLLISSLKIINYAYSELINSFQGIGGTLQKRCVEK